MSSKVCRHRYPMATRQCLSCGAEFLACPICCPNDNLCGNLECSKPSRLKAKQSALFKLQLWHLRRQKDFEADVRRLEKQLAGPVPTDWLSVGADYHESLTFDLRLSKRHAARHRRFVAAITPFVQP